MKFKYDTQSTPEVKPVAVVHTLIEGDQDCLAVTTNRDKTVWFYPDGEILVLSADLGLDQNPKKVFYPGDSITITF